MVIYLENYMSWSEDALRSEIDHTRRYMWKINPYTQEFDELAERYNDMCEAFYNKFGYGAYQD